MTNVMPRQTETGVCIHTAAHIRVLQKSVNIDPDRLVVESAFDWSHSKHSPPSRVHRYASLLRTAAPHRCQFPLPYPRPASLTQQVLFFLNPHFPFLVNSHETSIVIRRLLRPLPGSPRSVSRSCLSGLAHLTCRGKFFVFF